MHYKKRKLFVLYSIPIWFRRKINSFSKSNLCKEKLYLVSCSIPLKHMGVLLLTGMMCSIACSVLGSLSGSLRGECYAAASATLELGASNLMDEVAQGSTAYASSTIKASGNNDIGSYTLSITGPVQLSNGTTKLNGANNKIGSELGDNTWGYSYNEGNKSNENKTYKSFTGSAQELAKASATTGNKVTIDNTAKDITFAARFADNATTGEYKATVTISLVASPATVVYRLTYDANGGNANSVPSAQAETNSNDSHSFTIASTVPARTGYTFQGWSETSNGAVQYTANGTGGTSKTITLQKTSPTKTLYAVWKANGASWTDGTSSGVSNMQDIGSNFCNSSIPAGSTITLTDNRGTKIPYKIIKMKDGTCWMAENLRLMNTTIYSTDSDMTSDSFTIPASSTSSFGYDMNATDGYAPHAYYNNDTVYGAYYNWYTATAGAGTSSVSSGDVNTSICPKGWKLPAYDGTGSFYNIIDGANGYKSSWTSVGGKNGYMLGYNSTNAFWPAVGRVTSGSLGYTGYLGYYWSRRASWSGSAYNLVLDHQSEPGYVYPRANNARYDGYSVRCVAEP